MRLLFILSTFLGSFALFLLEPMVAKALLPSFGGSSMVWNVCLLFFQGALLAGYGYANVLTQRVAAARTAPVHAIVLVTAFVLTICLFLPGGLWHVHPSADGSPIAPLLTTLALTTAAPFVVLSAGTPLIQRWYAHTDEPHAHDPYFLYAASNLGSFFGLIAFPVAIEPRLTLSGQRALVVALFAVYGASLLLGAVLVRRHVVKKAEDDTPDVSPPISPGDRALWTALSAGPAALLLAATTDLTKDIAPIPLLWVLPLALYLLTFVIVFSNRARAMEAKGGSPIWLKFALGLAAAGFAYVMLVPDQSIEFTVPVALFTFFVIALSCHLQLARRRPAASKLTEYYLWVSIGGVLGGLFCAILAPLLFTSPSEFPIAMGFCVILYALSQPKGRVSAMDALFSVLGVAAVWGVWMANRQPTFPAGVACLLLLGTYLVLSLWPLRFTVAFLAYLAMFAFSNRFPGQRLLFAARNYYGYEAVVEEGDPLSHYLINGRITHGLQYEDPMLRLKPTTYYAEDAPLGEALLPTLDSHPHAKIGAVGLGSGTEAAYGRPGVHIDFYELNPTVKRIATDPSLFTYLHDSKATTRIILGDARLSIQNAPSGEYDVIILDAFSSDSIPVHLLTKEAYSLYESKLKPDGIILVHTSNRYLSLAPFVAATAASAGLTTDLAEDDRPATTLAWKTTWLCLARTRDRLTPLESKTSFWAPYTAPEGTRGWTDDYSNVFGALRVFNPG